MSTLRASAFPFPAADDAAGADTTLLRSLDNLTAAAFLAAARSGVPGRPEARDPE